jgi:hypothetical protein
MAKLVDFLLRLLLGVPVFLLNLADELVLLTADARQLIIGEGAPLLFVCPSSDPTDL